MPFATLQQKLLKRAYQTRRPLTATGPAARPVRSMPAQRRASASQRRRGQTASPSLARTLVGNSLLSARLRCVIALWQFRFGEYMAGALALAECGGPRHSWPVQDALFDTGSFVESNCSSDVEHTHACTIARRRARTWPATATLPLAWAPSIADNGNERRTLRGKSARFMKSGWPLRWNDALRNGLDLKRRLLSAALQAGHVHSHQLTAIIKSPRFGSVSSGRASGALLGRHRPAFCVSSDIFRARRAADSRARLRRRARRPDQACPCGTERQCRRAKDRPRLDTCRPWPPGR